MVCAHTFQFLQLQDVNDDRKLRRNLLDKLALSQQGEECIHVLCFTVSKRNNHSRGAGTIRQTERSDVLYLRAFTYGVCAISLLLLLILSGE